MSDRKHHIENVLNRSLASFRELASNLLELLYPSDCAVCGTSDTGLTGWPLCFECLSELHPTFRLHSLVPCVFLGFHEGVLRETVRLFKRGLYEDLATRLGWLLGKMIAVGFTGLDAIVPVPSTPVMIARRGFNPAAAIACGIASSTGVPLLDGALFKTRETAKQALLDLEARRNNVRGVYRARPIVNGLKILLTDDVLTSGSTLAACRQAIQEAGGIFSGAAFLSRRRLFVRDHQGGVEGHLRGRESNLPVDEQRFV